MVRTVTNDDVDRCLNMNDAISVLERAYLEEAGGSAVNIPRSDMILPMGANDAYVFKVLPGAIEGMEVAAVRLQSDHIRWEEGRKVKIGAARGGRYAQSVLVYDTTTCEPILLMPDGYASMMRVGATNALGAQYMARRDSSVVGLLGAGRQAGGQIWGFDSVFDLDTIRVFSPTRENRDSFASEWDARLAADVVPVDDARAAVSGADILACSSNAMEPIFDTDWIEPGMHVSAIKNPEVPDEVYHEADRVAIHTHTAPFGPNNYAPRGSDFGQRLTDAWSIENFEYTAVPELADLIEGDVGRDDPDETSLFVNNMGTGIQFAAIGRHVHDTAVESGLGSEIDTQHFLQTMW